MNKTYLLRGMPGGMLGAIPLLMILWTQSAVASQLNQKIETIRAEQQLAGVSWVTVTPNSVTTGATGFSNLPEQQPLGINSRVHVGSLTKTVLATGVLRLATEGLIDLEQTVAHYLPELRINNPWPTAVTVRHLLDHTAGLEDARLWHVFSQHAEPDSPLLDTLSRTDLVIRTRPGSQYSYSNLSYGLLAAVVERIAVERYESYLDRTLLQPLGMTSSTFTFTTQAGPTADPMLAWGHFDNGSAHPALPIFLRPAGQFTTTPADLGRLIQFLLGEGQVQAKGETTGEPFVAADLMNARGRPASTLAAAAGLEAGYAFGVARRDRHDHVGYCHPGNIVGFNAMLCTFPEQGKGFAYAVNSDREGADYNQITAALIDALELTKAPEPTTAAGTAQRDQWLGYYVLEPNRFEQFRYLDRLFSITRLSDEDDRLLLQTLSSAPRELTFTNTYQLTADDRRTASHVLLRGNDGQHLISDGFNTLRKTNALWLVLLWLSLGVGLLALLWFLLFGLYGLFQLAIKNRWPSRVAIPACLATASLALPIPLFFTQSYAAIGDATPASVTMAAVTGLLPLGAVWTLWRLHKTQELRTLDHVHRAGVVGLLQWCIVLFGFGMLPLRLWS